MQLPGREVKRMRDLFNGTVPLRADGENKSCQQKQGAATSTSQKSSPATTRRKQETKQSTSSAVACIPKPNGP